MASEVSDEMRLMSSMLRLISSLARLLLGGRGDGAHLVRGQVHQRDDLLQGLPARVARPVAVSIFATDCSTLSMFLRVRPGYPGWRRRLLGGGHGLFGQLSDLVGHHGEAPAGLAGPGGLDGGV
jgi:hypothetical protein